MKMSFSINNFFIRLGQIASIIVTFTIILFGSYIKFSSDDFCYPGLMEGKSLWQIGIKHYLLWDGRGIALGYYSGTLYKLFEYPFVLGILFSIFLLSVSYWIMKILLCIESVRNRKSFLLIGTGLISSVFWVGSEKFIGQAVYWISGSFYIFSTLLMVLCIYIVFLEYTTSNSYFKGRQYFLAIPLFFYTALFGVQPASVIFMALSFISMIALVKCKWKALLKIILLLAIVVFGIYIVVTAPGNTVRLAKLPYKGEFHPSFYIPYYLFSLEKAFEFSGNTYLYTLVALIPIVYLVKNKFSLRDKTVFPRWLFLFILSSLGMLAVCLPFIYLNDYIPPRTAVYFTVLLIICIISGGMVFLSGIGILFYTFCRWNDRSHTLKMLLVIPAILGIFTLFVFHVLQFHSEIKLAISMNLQAEYREQSLKSASVFQDSLIPEKIQSPYFRIPFQKQMTSYFYFEEISENPKIFPNFCLSEFYGLKKVNIQNENN